MGNINPACFPKVNWKKGENQLQNVTLIESKNTVQTDGEGNYLLSTNTSAPGYFFNLEGFETQTFSIEVPEGGEITQDVNMNPKPK